MVIIKRGLLINLIYVSRRFFTLVQFPDVLTVHVTSSMNFYIPRTSTRTVLLGYLIDTALNYCIEYNPYFTLSKKNRGCRYILVKFFIVLLKMEIIVTLLNCKIKVVRESILRNPWGIERG